MKRLLAAFAVLLALGTSAQADSFKVNITSGNIGQGLGNGHYAGTFTVTGVAPPAGPYTAFCADLKDHVSFGTTPITGQIYYGPINPGLVPNSIWAGGVTNYPGGGNLGLGNRMDYLLTQVITPALGAGLSNAQAAALQSAVWHTMASSSAPENTGVTNPVLPLVTDIMNLVNGVAVNSSTWTLLNGITKFDTTGATAYGNPYEFLLVPGAGSGGGGLKYQVLVGITPVPEPSTLAIAGLGVLGFLGYGLKRRKSS